MRALSHTRERVRSGETALTLPSSGRHGEASEDGRSGACPLRAARGRTPEGCEQGCALNFVLSPARNEQVSSGAAAISRRLAAGQQGTAGVLLPASPLGRPPGRPPPAWRRFSGCWGAGAGGRGAASCGAAAPGAGPSFGKGFPAPQLLTGRRRLPGAAGAPAALPHVGRAAWGRGRPRRPAPPPAPGRGAARRDPTCLPACLPVSVPLSLSPSVRPSAGSPTWARPCR